VRKPPPDILLRYRAACELLREEPGEDGALILSFVIWPSAALAAPPPTTAGRPTTRADVEAVFALREQGLALGEISRRVFGLRGHSRVGEILKLGREAALAKVATHEPGAIAQDAA
jgi:hypothetical protein